MAEPICIGKDLRASLGNVTVTTPLVCLPVAELNPYSFTVVTQFIPHLQSINVPDEVLRRKHSLNPS